MNSSEASSSSDSIKSESGSRRQKRNRLRKNRNTVKSLMDDKRRPARTYEERITAHWDCKMEDTLPVELRPSHRQPTGKPINREQLKTKKLPLSAWTTTFKRSLLKLASATSADRDFAHRLLAEQVRSRQSTRSHLEFYAKEALTSDLDVVLAKVKSLTASGRYSPRKTANKLDRLRQDVWAVDAKDAYHEAGPEDLGEWSNVPRDNVTRQLTLDRENARIAREWHRFEADRRK